MSSEKSVLVGGSQEVELRNSNFALELLQNHIRQAGGAYASFSASGWKANLHWIHRLEKDPLPVYKFLPPKDWAESHGLSPDHELHQAEIKELMWLKDGATDMPISSRVVKRPRRGRGIRAGVMSDATVEEHTTDDAAEEHMSDDGSSAEDRSDKENRRKALWRLRDTAYKSGDKAFSLAGWEPIGKSPSDGSPRAEWKFVPPKVWADANGVDDTCALTIAAVKEITIQRAKEGRRGCNPRCTAADDSDADIDASVPVIATREAGRPQEGPDHLTVQLAAAQKILTQQCSEHAAEQTRLRIRLEVQERQLKEQTDKLGSQAARIEQLTKERVAAEQQWSVRVEDLQSQLGQQAGRTADQTARAKELEAVVEAAEQQLSVKLEDLQSQLEQQAGRTADQTAHAKELQAALAAAEAAVVRAQEDARQAEASTDLSDSHILLRAAGIMQMDPILKQELLSVINT